MGRLLTVGSIVVLTTLLQAREPSVYGAGDIDSQSPYGLTPTEKGVLENRRGVQNLKNRVSEQQNRIDGLTTIIEGLNKEILNLKEQIKVLENGVSKANDNNKTYNLLMQLGKMIDEINANYVTKDELKEALAGSRAVFINGDGTASPSIGGGNSAEDISNVYREGVKLFGQRSFELARDYFRRTVAQNYKPASSNYYLGEIAYYTKNYRDAIEYYKKSASLYDSASYMKVLYLHTAISLKKIGEREQAKNFFQFVIDNYPNTKASEIAKKNL
jgi:TolA-binding protein